jgi:hypothetical protein
MENRVSALGVRSSASDLYMPVKLAKGLFASFILFTICWLPYGLVVIADFDDNLPGSVITYTMTIAHFNSTLNPVLYAFAYDYICISSI